MNKQEFVDTAPIYYALAICAYFNERSSPAYEAEIQSEYTAFDETNDKAPRSLLCKTQILKKAIIWLSDSEMIEPLLDAFGPPVYRPAERFYEKLQELGNDRSLPFYKYANVHQKRGWLVQALDNLNLEYDRLGITDDDFHAPDSGWAPLPIERKDPIVETAISHLEVVIEQVRGDNGYAASIPEERSYILTKLTSTVRTLQESAATSYEYLRMFALEPLERLICRFKGAAIAITATAARGAIIDFLKQHGLRLLDSVFR